MSESATNAFLERLAGMVERRRKAITMIHRTVLEVSTTIYLDTAARMAMPMLYAHWEGYVREALQSYLEHVEKLKIPQVRANPALLSYAWSQNFRAVASNQNAEARAEFTRKILAALQDPLAFHKKEHEIDVSSNLRFKIVEKLCVSMCLNVGKLKEREKALDHLVEQRNTIAHGGRVEGITVADVDLGAKLVVELIEHLEEIIRDAVINVTYLCGAPAAAEHESAAGALRGGQTSQVELPSQQAQE